MGEPTCLGPDPDPREPTWRPPPSACDAHCHVLGPTDRYPYVPERCYTPPEASVERLRSMHAVLGVQRAVLVNASCHGCDNSVVTDAIAGSGGAWRGIANVDDTFTERDYEMLHLSGIRGARFVYLKGWGGPPAPQMLRRIISRLRPFNWHVELNVDAADLPALEPLIQALPVPFVIDHMGRIRTEEGLEQPGFRYLLTLLASSERCWVKLCGVERVSSAGPPFTDAVPFAQALIATAPDRVVWGSGWPHPNLVRHMPNDGALLDMIPLMTPDPPMQQRLLVDNPERLYGWGHP